MFLVALVCLSVHFWATLLKKLDKIWKKLSGGVLGGTMKN